MDVETRQFLEDLRSELAEEIANAKGGIRLLRNDRSLLRARVEEIQGRLKNVEETMKDRVEVEAGDHVWLRAFSPQGCYAGGPEPFRYLRYDEDRVRGAGIQECAPRPLDPLGNVDRHGRGRQHAGIDGARVQEAGDEPRLPTIRIFIETTAKTPKSTRNTHPKR